MSERSTDSMYMYVYVYSDWLSHTNDVCKCNLSACNATVQNINCTQPISVLLTDIV